MAQAVWQGIILGFSLAFLIGPVFFLILSTSINKGFRPAVSIAIGVMLSDALCIFLAHLSNGFIGKYPLAQKATSIIGGALLLIWGLQSILKKTRMSSNDKPIHVISSRSIWRNVTNGFVVNTFNPFALIFWIGVVSAIASRNFTTGENSVFYFSALAMVLTTDIAKSYLAVSIQHMLSEKFIHRMNIISGAALILFGLQVLYSIFAK